MPRRLIAQIQANGVAVALLAVWGLLAPRATLAWGESAQRMVVNHAVDTLPSELRPFFEANRKFLMDHVDDPLGLIDQHPWERNNHFIELDKYGKFPFTALPRSYKAAIEKYSKSKIQATGLLPWQIGVYSQRLTEDLRAGRWDQARLDAAFLANFVAETHDPFNTTENFDGRLTLQNGINARFNSVLIARYGSFFPMSTHDAFFITDPTDYAFEACLESHSLVESVLLADRRALKGLNSYTDEYYDRFYNITAASLIRQLSEASTDVGSYWLTAWTNAGKPQLPH
jgi:hypothetical protein